MILAIFESKLIFTGFLDFDDWFRGCAGVLIGINTLGGLLLFLNKNPETLVKNIKKMINTLGYLSIWKAIELQSPKINKQEIKIIADGF